jgi:hypothetical protein
MTRLTDLPADLRQLPAMLDSSGLLDVPPVDASPKNPYAPAFAAAVKPVVQALARLSRADPRCLRTHAGPAHEFLGIPTFSFLNDSSHGFEPAHNDVFGGTALLQLQAVYVEVAPAAHHHPGPRIGLILPKWTDSVNRRYIDAGTDCNMFVITAAGESFVECISISHPRIRDVFTIAIGRKPAASLASNGSSGSSVGEASCNRKLGFPGACAYIAGVIPLLPAYLESVADYLSRPR